MGPIEMLTAYLAMLEGTRDELHAAMQQVLTMMEENQVHEKEEEDRRRQEEDEDEALDDCMYDVSLVSRMKSEVMVMSKLSPSLVVEVKHARQGVDSSLNWLIQVVCTEHESKWEIAACPEEWKKGRTEFTTDLILPIHLVEDPIKHCWTETLPGIQLNHEWGVKDLAARKCYCHNHRFQICVSIVDGSLEPLSTIAESTPFVLAPYTSGKSADEYIFGQAQKARRLTKHFPEAEIRERVDTTKIYLLEERKHIPPKVEAIQPNVINISAANSDFVEIEIEGQNFHRPNVVRIDADFDDADIHQKFNCSSTTSVGCKVKVPCCATSWMVKVKNFDDPNLDSDDYLYLKFIKPEENAYEGDDALSLPTLFPNDELPFIPSAIKIEEKPDKVLFKYKQNCKSRFSPVHSPSHSFVDRSLFHYHVMNGNTHTVASMLNSIEARNNGLRMKFGAIPAMLSLVSENPCTVVLCLALYFFEKRHLNHTEFKQLLSYILCPDRAIPLHPHMMLDFLENELKIDARVRFMKATIIFAENFLGGEDAMSDDDSSYQSEEDEYVSTSDEDYELPPAKILKSSASTGSLKICLKIEQPKNGGFDHVPLPSMHLHDDCSPKKSCECDWENCLVCERDIPIMLQTQNPTWAAIMRVVFFSFIRIFPNDQYWKVRQAYKYIEDHWDKLCPGKTQAGGGWRKQLQDALSHNKQYFISGMNIFNQKGYWGLKQKLDPWAITDEDDYPKRAYNHQPRRGRPPKGSNKKRNIRKMSRRFLD